MAVIRHEGRIGRLFACYLAAVAAACWAVEGLPLADRCLLASAHVAAAVLLLRRAARREEALALPYLLWLVCWLELGWLFRLSGRAACDPAVVAADLALFGGHGHVLLAAWLPRCAAAMQSIYLSYYVLVLGPPLLLARRGQAAVCRRYTLAVMATYLCCFLCYVSFPVLGPRAAAARSTAPREAGAVKILSAGAATVPAALAEALRRAGDSPGTAFPSSHCAGAFAAALAAGRLVRRRLRIALLTWAALIAVSTVHTGNHYSIDALAGTLLALAVSLAVTLPGRARPASDAEAMP